MYSTWRSTESNTFSQVFCRMNESFSKMADREKQKKRKRSFFQMQKRFARNGDFGRGAELPLDLYEYLINLKRVINSQNDEDEMCVLAANAFHEIEGKEGEYCCNQLASRIVESLLPHADDLEFSKFIEKFSTNLRPIFSDPFGSHVLQQTLVVAYSKYKIGVSSNSDDKLHIKFKDYIFKVSNFLFNNLEDFIWNTYSNAIARTVFNVLSGHAVKGEINLASPEVKSESEIQTPEEFSTLLNKFSQRLLSWPHFNDLCNQSVNSSFLQSLLLAIKETDQCSEVINKIISFYQSSPLDLTQEEYSPFVRLLEVVVYVAGEDDFKKVYKSVIKKNVISLATSKSGNFLVQKFLINCRSTRIFEKEFAKLSLHLEGVLKLGYSGVLLALVKGCKNLGVMQGDCITILTKVFQIKDKKDIVPLVVSLTDSENFDPENSNTTLNGVLIVEELLYFKKPINIVNSLLEMSETNLVKLLSDVRGCHLTDAFVNSQWIGEKSRDRLFKKLRGYYLGLATSKHGSRSLDAIWSVINVQQKALLAEELMKYQGELCADSYGKGFARKIHLSNFRRNKEEWMRIHKTLINTEKYFSDIIPTKKQKIS